MGLGGPNLVKGATGQTIDAETLGGAAHPHRAERRRALPGGQRRASACARIREYIGRLPRHRRRAATGCWPPVRPPARPPTSTTSSRTTTGSPTTCATCSRCLLDGGALDEFQPGRRAEMICGHAHIEGWPVGVIANQRGVIKGRPGERPRFGGIVYTGSAEKVAYFIETASRERLPILFVQDVSGFMVGPEAEHCGIIRAGAHFVEAMATAVVPKIVLTVNHASGAGLLRDGGAGVRSRLHPLLAHRAHGRDGGRVGGDGGARRRDRAGPAGEARARRRGAGARSSRCAPTTSTSSTPATRRRAGTWTPSSRPRRPATCSPSRSGSRANYAGPAPRPLRAAAARRGLRPLGTHAPALALAVRCSPPRWPAPPPRREPAGPGRRQPRSPARDPAARRATGERRRGQPPAAESGRSGIAPPEVAYAHGWMPLASTGVDRVPARASRPMTAAGC